MFKAAIKSIKSAKAHVRPPIFSLLLLASLCIFSPLIVHDAHAATNPKGTTINTMEATTSDLTLENYGIILDGKDYTVSGSTYQIGMYGNSAGNASFSFSNFGDIIFNNAPGHSYGMYANSVTGSHRLTNNGTISINASNPMNLYGMYANGNGSHMLTNNGTISINGAFHLFSHGMRANGDGSHVLINNGTISIHGTHHQYYALHARGSGSHTLINSGTIIINANNSSAAMRASDSSNLYNSGFISVRGTQSEIYGMMSEKDQDLNINNTGIINVWGALGLASEANSEGGNLNVGTWATTLRNFSINDNVFSLRESGMVGGPVGHVNFNNTTLILRPGTSAQGFQLGKTYNVADMIYVVNNHHTLLRTGNALLTTDVIGTIAEAVGEVPFLKATLVNGNDPLTATVRLDRNVNDETTPGSTTMQQAVSQVQSQFNNLSLALRKALINIYTEANLVADAGQNSSSGVAAGSNFAPSNKWQVFLNPYANTVNNSKYDYNGNNMGITAGASYRVSDSFSFGAHLDFNSANYYADIMDMSTKSTSFALGLHAAYNFTPEWYLRGQLTGSVNQNDGYYETITLNADTNYNGEAMYAELATGYTWQIANGHSLTPEIGVSYLSMHTDAYDIRWGGAGSLYDMSYADSYYNAYYGTLNLDWRSEFELENDASIAFLVGLGLRQNLDNGEMKTNFQTFGLSYTAKATEDLTTFLADVGVEYKKGNFSVSLNYDGGFGTHQTSHGGNVMVKLEF